jgi:hypothetical protein
VWIHGMRSWGRGWNDILRFVMMCKSVDFVSTLSWVHILLVCAFGCIFVDCCHLTIESSLHTPNFERHGLFRHDGFVALGILRLLPKWMSFLVRNKVNRWANDVRSSSYLSVSANVCIIVDNSHWPICLALNKHRLYKYGAMTVRDVQHAILKLGYTIEQLLRNCPKAPEGTRRNAFVTLV